MNIPEEVQYLLQDWQDAADAAQLSCDDMLGAAAMLLGMVIVDVADNEAIAHKFTDDIANDIHEFIRLSSGHAARRGMQ
jgi:hypothetical protein